MSMRFEAFKTDDYDDNSISTFMCRRIILVSVHWDIAETLLHSMHTCNHCVDIAARYKQKLLQMGDLHVQRMLWLASNSAARVRDSVRAMVSGYAHAYTVDSFFVAATGEVCEHFSSQHSSVACFLSRLPLRRFRHVIWWRECFANVITCTFFLLCSCSFWCSATLANACSYSVIWCEL